MILSAFGVFVRREIKMKRHVSLAEISDGRLYGKNDMAKVDCGGCKGCHACCSDMGTSIILDPMDIAVLTKNLDCTFESLLQDKIELNVVDGVILPNLKMSREGNCCAFLDKAGRCTIHSFRPGICRLFPLGRYYENHGFKYFIQVHECKKGSRGKIKIHKWLNIRQLERYESYITDWHYFLNDVEKLIETTEDESVPKKVNMYILNTFFVKPLDPDTDFYTRFEERLKNAKDFLMQTEISLNT